MIQPLQDYILAESADTGEQKSPGGLVLIGAESRFKKLTVTNWGPEVKTKLAAGEEVLADKHGLLEYSIKDKKYFLFKEKELIARFLV